MSNQTLKEIRENKSYAEGRHARAIGASLSTNPFPVELTADRVSWTLGYSVPDSTLDDTCYSGITGLPAPTGMENASPEALEMLNKIPGWSTGTNPLTVWPKDALKALLDQLGISYKPTATKAELIALVPDTHHEQIGHEVPDGTWPQQSMIFWIEAKGLQVPDGILSLDESDPDRKGALLEMVHDIIKLEASGGRVVQPLPPIDEIL